MSDYTIKKWLSACLNVAFPSVCACCGLSTSHAKRYVCTWCKAERFVHPPVNEQIILPQTVSGVYSMWRFDKGGYLQDLLHNLKYNYLRNVGCELGEYLGQLIVTEKPINIHTKKPLLLPVPLHKSKHRKRGFNQARAIAQGVASVTGWEIIPMGTIDRIKKTSTQTGLNSVRRAQNLRNAFCIHKPEYIHNFLPVIVDDVFTTGATTFELVRALNLPVNSKAFVITVARA